MVIKFGSVIKIDESTLNKSNLLYARVIIRTPLHEIPRALVKVMVDGKVFHIRIVEEEESDSHSRITMVVGGVTASREGESSQGVNEEVETSSVPCMGMQYAIVNVDIFEWVHVEGVGKKAAIVGYNPEKNMGKHSDQLRYEIKTTEDPLGVGPSANIGLVLSNIAGPVARKSPNIIT